MLKTRTNREIDYDAIHRSLLAGLLGNIGVKSEGFEYVGTRGTKFHVFPGSALFKRKPQWLMAAEVVETTKLYARTAARIDPAWVERAAEHLVKRTYGEPRWERETANVVADEKVTLYGLPIVPRRKVSYGPIDPKAARSIFVQMALVEAEYDTPAPFFTHNRKLVEEVRELEAKSREREFLVEDQVRYAFYDARVPKDVYNGHTFEKWRKIAERHNPKILFMNKRDLLRRSAEEVSAQAFPDYLLVGGTRVPLQYQLDPGEAMDGVTATIPLAALNQVPDEPFEWLVPGLLREKVLELIRTLPKPVRVNFVPAPDFADRAMDRLLPVFREGSFCEALAVVLGKLSGLQIRTTDLDDSDLPRYLLMNFRIIDQHDRTVQTGRNLAEIRRKLGLAAKATFAKLPPHPEYHRDTLTRWDFGGLPERIEIKRYGVTLGAYPALVDNVTSVSLRLFDSADEAKAAHRAGVRRLFMLQLGPELRHLWRRIPNIDRMALQYKLLGTPDDLRSQIVTAAADHAFAADGNIRTQAQFTARAGSAWHGLSEEHNRIADVVAAALAEFYELSKSLARTFPPLLEPSIADMRRHLGRLMPRDFVTVTPREWLGHLPRFLKGIGVRLTKLTNAGLEKDRQATEHVLPLECAVEGRRAEHAKAGVLDPALTHYRWMLEEFRVSLFAQELRTSAPVSPKRLSELWLQVRP